MILGHSAKHRVCKFQIPLIFIILSGLFLANFIITTPSPALAYSCGDQSGNHCYAWVRWSGGTIGLVTDILVTDISCLGCGPNFLDNESWLADTTNPAPNCTSNGGCWVEAGLSTDLGYFWAENLPGGIYHQHSIGYIPTGDSGQKANIFIIKTHNANEWQIKISSPYTSYGYQYAENNTITPNVIQTGTELSGSGAYSPTTTYTNNSWIDSSYYTHPQTNAGYLSPYAPPPYVQWYIQPSTSNPGGELWTHCC